jgi:hypothetical protein
LLPAAWIANAQNRAPPPEVLTLELLRGTQVVETITADTPRETRLSCVTRMRDLARASPATYRCQTQDGQVIVTFTPSSVTPAPAATETAATGPAPYPLYDALDLSRVPWHNGAGAWGPQVQLQAPALPVTTRTVDVSSLQQFNRAASVSGTLINITRGWAGDTTATIDANDIDVVIPAGVAIGAVELGTWPRDTALARIRIRGDGRMGQYRDHASVSDVTIDGIDLNGDSGFDGAETDSAFRIASTRVAVLNVRATASAYVWLGDARQAVIANSNLFHGAATRDALGGDIGGWGIRNTGGPLTIVDSRIQGTRYNNLRTQPAGRGGDLLYVARTTFVNTAEGGRVAWLWDNLGNSRANGQGAIIEDSAIYSYGPPGCASYTDLRAPNVTYSRIRRNRFFSGGSINWSQAVLDSMEKLPAGDHDWSVGNTFERLAALPDWGGPGDPTQIPLPRRLSFSLGAGACVSPY